jgi:hypothetical protein
MIRVKPVSLGNIQELAGAESSQTARVMYEDANGNLKPLVFKTQGLLSASDSGMVFEFEAEATLRRAIRVAEPHAVTLPPGSRIEIVTFHNRPFMKYTPMRWVNFFKGLIPFYSGRNYIVEADFGVQLYQGDSLVRRANETQRRKTRRYGFHNFNREHSRPFWKGDAKRRFDITGQDRSVAGILYLQKDEARLFQGLPLVRQPKILDSLLADS